MSILLQAVLRFFDGPVPEDDPEKLRRARLLTGFGLMGAVFGTAYTAFYLSIAHYLGALVIIVCSALFAIIPWLLRWGWSQALLAETYSGILVCGFFALCWLEDGIHGHAIAWFVSVPLCAILLIGLKAAARWGLVCALATGFLAALEFLGMSPGIAYPPKWENLVSSVGYLGLIAFMLLLGILFERSRALAARRMIDANKQLSAANDRLVQLNQEKNEFLSIAAHDLKNPLTVVRGMADLLAMGRMPTEKLRSTAEKISGQAIRMHDLIANLLDLNAIEEGRMNLNIESIDATKLVQQVCENFTEVAARKQIRLNYVSEIETSFVLADRRAALQVLDNLVSNAIKYSPSMTEVDVRMVGAADSVAIEVIDRGPGISDADQKKLFQRFTRLTARPTAGESSNGLGLSIVKRLVEAMNGRISCRSQLGKGTTFVLEFPLDRNSIASADDHKEIIEKPKHTPQATVTRSIVTASERHQPTQPV